MTSFYATYFTSVQSKPQKLSQTHIYNIMLLGRKRTSKWLHWASKSQTFNGHAIFIHVHTM